MIFFNIFTNRIRVLFTDKLFILAMLIVPIALSLITGYAQNKEKLGYIPVLLVDEDHSEYSERLCDRLKAKEGLRTVLTDRERALKELSEDNAETMIVIEEGLERNFREGKTENVITLVKSPSTYSAELLKEIIAVEALRIYTGDFTYEWIAESFKRNGLNASDISREEIIERVEAYWQPKPIMEISYEEIEAIPEKDKAVSIPSFAAASLGLMVLFIMLGLLFGSGWLCEEKANGTLQRVLSIRNAAMPLFMGNVTALLAMGLFQTFVFVSVQSLLFKVTLVNGVYSWLVIFMYNLCAASMSMLMAALFETPHQLQAAAPVFALITGLMGGCLWNLLGVPESLVTMSLLTPQGWTLRALTGLYAAPAEPELAMPAVLMLGGLSVLMLSLAYWRLLRMVRTNIS